MPRPCKKRRIKENPKFNYFKPAWIPNSKLEQIDLKIDEYEAVRLYDYIGLDTKQWADKMEISPSTFNRILKSARYKISKALIETKSIKIYSKKDNA